MLGRPQNLRGATQHEGINASSLEADGFSLHHYRPARGIYSQCWNSFMANFFLRIPLFLPFHRVLMHLSKFLCFGRSRSKAPAPAPADSRDPDRVSSSHSPPAAHVSAPRPESSPHGTRLSRSVIIKYSPSQLIPPLHPPPALCLVARLPNPIMHGYRLLRVQYPRIHIWSSLNIFRRLQ
jgi:hypothetical protein